MNVTIELSEEKAAALKAQADAQGLTIERWLEQIAEQHVQPTRKSGPGNSMPG